MSKKNKLFAASLFSVIITFAFSGCGKKEDARLRAPENQERSGLSPAAGGEFAYDAAEKRDPFITLVSSDGRVLEPQINRKTDRLNLEGIMYDPAGFSYAVINAQVLKVGEMAGDYQVIRIEPQKVILIKDGKELEAELKKED